MSMQAGSPVPPEAARAPVTPQVPREIALTSEQTAYLTQQTAFGSLARQALGAAALTPVIVFVILASLTRLVYRIPIIGWFLAIYGVIIVVAGSVLGAVAIPLVFLVTLPGMLFGRRAKLRRDIEGGVAVRRSGMFEVKESASGGSLTLGDAKFEVSKDQLGAIRPALTDRRGATVLNGAVEHTPNQLLLLAVCDATGRVLAGSGQA